MGSVNKTVKLFLSQFVGSDKPDWKSDYNDDMRKIEEGTLLTQDYDPVTKVKEAGGIPAYVSLLVPPGAMMQYSAAVAPAGWLLCQGQMVSRTTHASLFATIGTTYGSGDGTTTFAVPDMRGRTTVGCDANFGLGQNRGVDTVNLKADQNGLHNHTVSLVTHEGGVFLGGLVPYTAKGTNDTSGRYIIANSGTGAPHENRQPSVGINYIIKT